MPCTSVLDAMRRKMQSWQLGDLELILLDETKKSCD